MFFGFTSSFYDKVSEKTDQIASYNEALNNSKALESERDKLTQKYNTFSLEDLSRIQKLVPDNVDNIRLILEIEKIASPYGMVLKDVKYETQKKDTGEETPKDANKVYGAWDLAFSTQGRYGSFINFVKDLENNLRIVDISSIQFSSNLGKESLSSSDSYKYDFKIKTYWLKN